MGILPRLFDRIPADPSDGDMQESTRLRKLCSCDIRGFQTEAFGSLSPASDFGITGTNNEKYICRMCFPPKFTERFSRLITKNSGKFKTTTFL